jgi:hypothetical protein
MPGLWEFAVAMSEGVGFVGAWALQGPRNGDRG